MTEINIIIEKSKDGAISARCEKDPFSGFGNTIEEAKDKLKEQIKLFEISYKDCNYYNPPLSSANFNYKYNCKVFLKGINEFIYVYILFKDIPDVYLYLSGKKLMYESDFKKLIKRIETFKKKINDIKF